MTMKITPERFTTIVEAYGSQPRRWPANERAAALDYLEQHPAAQTLVAEHRMLDELLDQFPVLEMSRLEQRVLEHAVEEVDRNLFDRLMDWLLPRSGRVLAWMWRPALVACLPLICGLYLGNYYSFGIDGTQNSREEELYMLSLNDYAETLE